jgi:predicted flap endonuclease-1-like 5' DNA nuclease
MSSACTQMCLVSVPRMEALARELRQLQTDMVNMQVRLELVLGDLANELHRVELPHDEAPAEAATPTAPWSMQQATSPLLDADIGSGETPLVDAAPPIDAAAIAPTDAATNHATEPVAGLPVLYADQLQWIAMIDQTAIAILRDRGITTFAAIAAMTARDVREIGVLIGDMHLIAKHGWIEQAALLAHGIDAAYARKVTGTQDPAWASPINCSHAQEITGAMDAALLAASEAFAIDVQSIVEPTMTPPAPAETATAVAEPAAQSVAPEAGTLPDNVIDLAARRRATALNPRPFVARAARWAATIVLTVTAAALTATQVGLASDSTTPRIELPAIDTRCSDMSAVCAILPGIPW